MPTSSHISFSGVRRACLAVAALLLILASCSSENELQSSTSAEAQTLSDSGYAASAGVDNETAQRSHGINDYLDLLTNRSFYVDSREADLFGVTEEDSNPFTDAVVVGKIVDVEAGTAHTTNPVEGTGSDGLLVNFFGEKVHWRNVVVPVEVKEVLGKTKMKIPDVIRVVKLITPHEIDFEKLRASIISVGDAVFFVSDRKFPDDPDDVYRLAYGGSITFRIEDNGELTVPFPSHELVTLQVGAANKDGSWPTDLTIGTLRTEANRVDSSKTSGWG